MTYLESLPTIEPRRKPKHNPYKKPESVKRLQIDYQRFYYASRITPENLQCPFKFRDDTANGLTQCVCSYLKMHGYFVGRVNTTGTYNQKLGRFIKSGSTKGMADVTAVIRGKHVSIEIKVGRDKPRPEQLKVKEQIEQSGGVYMFVRSYDDFLRQIQTI